MAFITIADELKQKSTTSVENKFINKYLPELDPVAVKVYLFALYLSQTAQAAYNLEDFSKKLDLSEDQLIEYFEYLSEWELVSITSHTPFEVKILDCDNLYGKPKKLHPEKFEGLYEEIQTIISERMINQNEFRDYLILLEEYGMERNALIMIVNYCVNLRGANIRSAYVKKVIKSFCDDGDVTVERVENRLSSYSLSTAAIIKIFAACTIKRTPEVEDGELFNKWIGLGFSEEAICCAAKAFKTKTMEKLDAVLDELANNRKFDAKEIDDYKKIKDSLYSNVKIIAKTLGVYLPDATPYVEQYYSVWVDYGFSSDALKSIASHCFLSGRNSFELMNDFIEQLYNDAYVDDDSVFKILSELEEDNRFIKKIHTACGYTREIKPYDRQSLGRWRGWGFNDEMILKAADLSAGKNNPVAAINYLLSQWKNAGIYTIEKIPTQNNSKFSKPKKSLTEEWLETLNNIKASEDTNQND